MGVVPAAELPAMTTEAPFGLTARDAKMSPF
jgi:hypothetical protein